MSGTIGAIDIELPRAMRRILQPSGAGMYEPSDIPEVGDTQAETSESRHRETSTLLSRSVL